MNQCKYIHQGLIFAGVNANHQNGQVDQCIRSLQDLTRCQMINSHHRWPSAISPSLCTYEICHAFTLINDTTFCRHNYTSTHIHTFIKSKVDSNTRHWQAIFCLLCELARTLAAHQPFEKWK